MLIEVTVDDSNSFTSFSTDILDVKRDHDKLEVVIIPKYLKELTRSS